MFISKTFNSYQYRVLVPFQYSTAFRLYPEPPGPLLGGFLLSAVFRKRF